MFFDPGRHIEPFQAASVGGLFHGSIFKISLYLASMLKLLSFVIHVCRDLEAIRGRQNAYLIPIAVSGGLRRRHLQSPSIRNAMVLQSASKPPFV
jgi:hypothetical protein